MKKMIHFILCFSVVIFACKNTADKKTATKESSTIKEVENTGLKIFPIKHATTVLTYKENTIYIDPTGGTEAFKDHKKPNLVFITDIHGDHMSIKTLNALDLSEAIIIAPKVVADNLRAISAKEIVIMNNGDLKSFDFLKAEAIPMYNLREEALKFHAKGRGNGYVLTINNERIYFSGDTEDIPEMRALKNIEKAFVCMNLPYTMTVESAANAVLEFQPKKVYPYHYRGTNGMSDVGEFKRLINAGNKDIKVIQLSWY